MKVGRVIWLATVAYGVLILATMAALSAFWPRSPTPYGLPTAGVPGCTPKSERSVIVPAGATVAFSCPTHIEVSSADGDVPTVLTWKRAR